MRAKHTYAQFGLCMSPQRFHGCIHLYFGVSGSNVKVNHFTNVLESEVEGNPPSDPRLVLTLCRTIFLVLLFSQYARNVQFPLPIYKFKKGWTVYRLQVFKMFPVSLRTRMYHVSLSRLLLSGWLTE